MRCRHTNTPAKTSPFLIRWIQKKTDTDDCHPYPENEKYINTLTKVILTLSPRKTDIPD